MTNMSGDRQTERWSDLASSSNRSYPFNTGDRLPDVTLPSVHDGKSTSLTELRGRHLLLHFFASW